MDAGSVTMEAFRFLDVRAPKSDRDYKHAYVIDRQLLNFPETPLESSLKGLSRDGAYTAQLSTFPTAHPMSAAFPPVSGGFLASLSDYEASMLRKNLAPEAMYAAFKELYLASKGAAPDDVYLLTPTSQVWDLFLIATILMMSGQQVEARILAWLSSALHVAGAIFAVRAAGNDEIDIQPYAIASIRIDSTLIDTAELKKNRPAPTLPVADSAARELQNELLQKLLKLELASRELHTVLLEGGAAMPPPPAPAPAPAAGAGDVLEKLAAQEFVVNIPKTKLSSSTQDLLVNVYGAANSADTIDLIPIVPTLAKIDYAVTDTGQRLYSTSSAQTIGRINGQLKLLTKELATSGTIAAARLAALPLAIVPPSFVSPLTTAAGANANVRPLGIGDLKVVKQSLLRYEPGEVGHIENVLQGQEKERLHSVKQKTEETLIVEKEKSTSTEKDLQTTDRFELSDESSKTVAEKRQNEAGVTVSASYGTVSISANTKFSDTSSQEQSSKIARNFAREVVDRSVEKVQQRVREERIRKTTLEIEETNRHSLSAPNGNVVGIYRWVDKIYWAQVHVYGKRLMLEFMIPEPAALYLYSQTVKPADPSAVSPPEPFTLTSQDITRSNYASLASKYGAEVENPPPSVRLAKFVPRSEKDTAKTAITLEDGWIGLAAAPVASYVGTPGRALLIHIGDGSWDTRVTPWSWEYLTGDASGEIPLTVTAFNVSQFNVTGAVISMPSKTRFEKWQLETYKAIQAAYRIRLSDYQDYLRAQRPRESNMDVRPDQENRDIERRELQRACIEILSLQHFSSFGSITANPTSGWPEIDFKAAKEQGDTVLFFQHSFEWEQMTYVFYPYFWARQTEWSAKLAAGGGDLLFSRFLTAGFARVVVPVRPAYESDALYYLETGIPWSGTEPPVIGDPRYVNIIDEIKESLDAPDNSVTEGEPWEVKIPTSLVILNDSAKLPEWPLKVPPPSVFVPSKETCAGVPYNAAQWKDAKTVADGIRKLGYSIDPAGDQALALKKATGLIRAMQMRFNSLGADTIIGRTLKVDGIVGPCTLRALTYFDALRADGKWPGVA